MEEGNGMGLWLDFRSDSLFFNCVEIGSRAVYRVIRFLRAKHKVCGPSLNTAFVNEKIRLLFTFDKRTDMYDGKRG
jgi:hypothetical protein